MKDSIFTSAVNDALLKRFQLLTPDTKPRWGILTPAQMMKHLQLENELSIGRYKGKDYSNIFRERTFKLVINGTLPLPRVLSRWRMIPAIPELDVVKSKIPVADFATEKKNLMKTFCEMLQADKLHGLHPGIGRMNKEEWGKFYCWHTNYHLEQFGL